MATMIEFAIVLVVRQRRWTRKKSRSVKKPIKEENDSTETMLVQTLKYLENGTMFIGQDNPRSFVRMIDFVALFTFSITYLLYNCIYFTQLLYVNKD